VYYTILHLMSGITIFADAGHVRSVCKYPAYVSVPPPAVIAVKAVCSEVNLPVPTACKVVPAGAANTAATFENLLQ
jgi:hypothetical protein